MSDWFMPAPIALTVPSSRKRIKGAKGAADGIVVVIIRIVDEQDVDAIEPQACEAVLHRTHHAVVAEIELRPLGRRALVVIVFRCGTGRAQHAADLGGDCKGVALLPAQKTAQAT